MTEERLRGTFRVRWEGGRGGVSTTKEGWIDVGCAERFREVQRVWMSDCVVSGIQDDGPRGTGLIYVCALRLPKPNLSVSLRDHGVMMAGVAWHGMAQAVS